jgi:DNA polymerase-3 subunit epsilon
MKLLSFDTETTGLPNWGIPSNDAAQPHLVEIAAQLVDTSTRETLDEMSFIIKPDGWSWDESSEAFQKHGITMERAMDEGIPEISALDQFMVMYERCDVRMAFNTVFDNRILRIAQMRYRFDPEAMRSWKEDKDLYVCAMRLAQKHIGGKTPSLVKAHAHFFGEDVFKETHRALADTIGAKEVYFALKDIGAV